jgi:hypothetical protein
MFSSMGAETFRPEEVPSCAHRAFNPMAIFTSTPSRSVACLLLRSYSLPRTLRVCADDAGFRLESRPTVWTGKFLKENWAASHNLSVAPPHRNEKTALKVVPDLALNHEQILQPQSHSSAQVRMSVPCGE